MDATFADSKVQLHSRVESLKMFSLMHEGLKDVGQVAVGYEQEVYTVATNQKVDSKLDLVGKNIQQTAPVNPSMPNSAIENQNPAVPALVDSSAGLVYLQEETFQKITSLKEQYLPRLVHLSKRVTAFLQDIEPEQERPLVANTYVVMKQFILRLDHVISTLQISKEDIQPRLIARLPVYEERISFFLDPPPKVKTDPPLQLQQARNALTLRQCDHGAF